MKKLLTLFTLLLTVCSGAWGVTPVTKTYGKQTYLDVANTIKNVTVETTNYVTLLRSDYSGVNTWYKGGSSNTGNIAGSFDANTMPGFLSGSGWNEGLSIKNSSGYIRPFFVTGTTGVAILGNDNNNSDKILKIVIEEVSEDGTLTDVGSKNGGNGDNSKSYMLDYGNTLSANKYYKITVTSDASSNSRFAQIRFTQSSAPAGPSISADDVNITANATGGNIAYTINNYVGDGTMTGAKQGEADWLLSVGNGDSPIAFTTQENTGAERSATVRLTYTYNTNKTVYKDVTITQAAPSFAITYAPGANASGSIEAGEKAFGVAFTLSSEMFTRDGYLQIGWATSDGGDKAYDLGGSYTTDAAITLYPVWAEKDTYDAAFSYDSENPDAAPEGWTFANAGTYGANDATVAYEGAFGATCPASGDSKNDNYIAFAKNTGSYAKYDLGISTTVSNVTGTFYVGSGNARTFTITYHGADDTVLKTVTVNHPAGNNWGADNVNETSVVPNVRYIKVNGMTSDLSWIVMSAFSVTFGNPNPATKYTVTYDLNGGAGTTPTQADTKEGGSFTLHDGVTGITAPDGKMFVAWNDGTNNYDGGALYTMPGENVTLTAQWTEHIAPTYGSLFSLSFVNSSKVTMSDGDNLDLTSTYATITGGSAMISYFKDGNNNKDVLTSNNEITYGTNDMYLKLTLNYPLQAGDVISFANGSGPQLSIATTAGTPKDQSSKVTTTSYSYTVEADDALDGKKVLYVGRSDASTTKHKAITINRPASVTITDLSAIGGSSYTGKNYATLYYSDAAIAVPAGVKAYTYKIEGGNLTVSRTYEKGGTNPVIPAGEAVVLESETGASYNFNMATTETTVDTESLLRGTDAEMTVDATGYKYYKLAMNDALTSVGFYFAVDGGTSITNGAHKAYLRVSTTASKEYFVLGGEDEANNETTAINAVDIAIANGATIYNLAGQKVGANYKGIVVINGKKVVRK